MRLRDSIFATEREGASAVTDLETGLRLSLSPDALALVQQLIAATGRTLEPASAEVGQFFAQLERIGLSADVPPVEAAWRQAAFIKAQATERALPALRTTLERAMAVSSFHRGRISRAQLDTLDGPAAFERLPLMGKADLRANFPEGLVDAETLRLGLESKELLFATTSGTTGDRLQVISDTRLPRFPPDFLERWDVGQFEHGYTPRTAVFTSPVCAGPVCHLGKAPMEERTVAGATLYLNSSDDIFSLDRDLAMNVLDELRAFRPDFLFVNPVYLAVLAMRLDEWGESLPTPRVIVSCYQYLSRAQRRLLTDRFRCPLYDLYSATDLGGAVIANECRKGSLHVRPDQVYCEVERDGHDLPPGELGRVVVTTHHPVMPLVRYAVGDCARWAPAPCSCELGSDVPRLQLEGRTRDVLRVGERWVTPRDVDEALAPLGSIAFYQLVEQGPSDFELAVIARPGMVAPGAEASDLLAPLLGTQARVRTVKRLRAERGQKFRLTVPKIEHPQLSASA